MGNVSISVGLHGEDILGQWFSGQSGLIENQIQQAHHTTNRNDSQ
ncbi:hypothetical protein GFS31_15540 [Leptolyngbya sp. BL0902]|nr:hypothetical protein GFS31_15540 [Leptolyngbya sp. BL0902]